MRSDFKVLLFILLLSFNSTFGQSSDDYFKNGIKKYKIQDYKGALAEFDRAIEIDPKFSKAYNNRGITKNVLLDIKGSVEDFDKAISIDPHNISAYRNRGLSKLKLNDIQGALNDFNTVLKYYPNDEIAIKHIKSHQTRDTLNNKSNHLKSIEDKILSKPDTKNPVNNLNIKKTEDVSNYNDTVVSKDKKLIPQNYRAEFINLTKMIEADSTNALAYFKRGLLRASLRNYISNNSASVKAQTPNQRFNELFIENELSKGDYGAIEDFSRAIVLNPNYGDAYYNRALSLYNLKQYKNAIANLNKVIELKPDNGDAYYHRGVIEGLLNDFSSACLDFKKAAELGNTDANDLVKDCR